VNGCATVAEFDQRTSTPFENQGLASVTSKCGLGVLFELAVERVGGQQRPRVACRRSRGRGSALAIARQARPVENRVPVPVLRQIDREFTDRGCTPTESAAAQPSQVDDTLTTGAESAGTRSLFPSKRHENVVTPKAPGGTLCAVVTVRPVTTCRE
jgi:hypothetical protein